MLKEVFDVDVDDWQEIHSLSDTWNLPELRALLEEAEFDDAVADADVEDMTLMALQDLGMREASDLVLRSVFGARMSSGVRQNLISELEEDRPWEQFADVEKQADIFRAVILLQKSVPNAFGTPDAGGRGAPAAVRGRARRKAFPGRRAHHLADARARTHR
jgi:hypothetical protein